MVIVASPTKRPPIRSPHNGPLRTVTKASQVENIRAKRIRPNHYNKTTDLIQRQGTSIKNKSATVVSKSTNAPRKSATTPCKSVRRCSIPTPQVTARSPFEPARSLIANQVKLNLKRPPIRTNFGSNQIGQRSNNPPAKVYYSREPTSHCSTSYSKASLKRPPIRD